MSSFFTSFVALIVRLVLMIEFVMNLATEELKVQEQEIE
jgi:hypothetical protein